MTETLRCAWCGNRFPEGAGIHAPDGEIICRDCAAILGYGA